MEVNELFITDLDKTFNLKVEGYGFYEFEKGFKNNLWIDTGACIEQGEDIALVYKHHMDKLGEPTQILDLDAYLYDHAANSVYHTDGWYANHNQYGYPIVNLADYCDIKRDLYNYIKSKHSVIHWVIFGKYAAEIAHTFIDYQDAGMIIRKINGSGLIQSFLNIFHIRNSFEDEFLDALYNSYNRVNTIMIGTDNSAKFYLNGVQYNFDPFIHGKRKMLFIDTNGIDLDSRCFKNALESMLKRNQPKHVTKSIGYLNLDKELETIYKNIIFTDIHNIDYSHFDPILRTYRDAVYDKLKSLLEMYNQVIIFGDKVSKYAPLLINRMDEDFALIQVSSKALENFSIDTTKVISNEDKKKFINFIKSF